jgi:hypothetical protein
MKRIYIGVMSWIQEAQPPSWQEQCEELRFADRWKRKLAFKDEKNKEVCKEDKKACKEDKESNL